MMTTAQKAAAGGGMFAKLVVVALLALTIALYLRIVMVEGPQTETATATPQASVRVVEGNEPAPAAGPLEELPAEQMELILQVFAPEMSDN
jgi:hypothetical protein